MGDLTLLSPSLAFNILNKKLPLLFQTIFQDWIHLSLVMVPLFQVVCVSIEFPQDWVLGLEHGSPLAQQRIEGRSWKQVLVAFIFFYPLCVDTEWDSFCMYSLLSCSINFTSRILPLAWKKCVLFHNCKSSFLTFKASSHDLLCVKSLYILTNFYPKSPSDARNTYFFSSQRRGLTDEVSCLGSIMRLRSVNWMMQAQILGPLVPRLSLLLWLNTNKALIATS